MHRRVLFWRVNANCDVCGFVERSGGVSLYGRGDRVYGSVPIHGALEGQGANRFTARIHGETEASATIEAEARPQLGRDWSLDLNFSDGFHWSEPPVLHVMGREIPLAKYAEPRIRSQLARVSVSTRWPRPGASICTTRRRRPGGMRSSRSSFPTAGGLAANDAAKRGLRRRARQRQGAVGFARALRHAPRPSIGQQRARASRQPRCRRSATTSSAPGTFDVILPVRIGYDAIKDKISQAIAALPAQDSELREVQVYPSSGKLVIGLRIAKASDSDPNAGQWSYLSGALKVDDASKSVALADLDLAAQDGEGQSSLAADRRAIEAGREHRLRRLLPEPADGGEPAADASAQGRLPHGRQAILGAVRQGPALADGITLALRASGELKILYGM